MSKRRLPIGIQTFRKIRQEDCYYVDKTTYIDRLLDEGTHYFLSRPRRFGKSLFLDTLKELFEGNEPLFEGLYIHDRWDWSIRHPVLRLSFGSGNFKEPDYLEATLMEQLAAAERRTGIVSEYATAPGRFAFLLEALHDQAGQPVAVLIDEYDKPILDALEGAGSSPRQPRLSARPLRGHQGLRCPRPLHVHYRREQVFQGQPVFWPQQPHRYHPRTVLLGPLRLYRRRSRTPYSRRNYPAWTGTRFAIGTTAIVGSATRRCTTPSTSSCCFAAAASPPIGLRPAHQHS